jgi:hypothetical protein
VKNSSVEPHSQRHGAGLPSRKPMGRKHWWLLLIPYLWCIAAVPFVNRVGYIFGNVPFLLVWMIAGVLLSSACVTSVFLIDRRRGELERI